MISRVALATALLVLAARPGSAQPFAEAFQTLFDGTGLAGVGALVASPDGRHLYAAGNDDAAIVALARNPATGRLAQIAVYREGDGGFEGISPAARLALGGDGRTLYAAGADRVAALRRDPESGTLNPGRTTRGFGITQVVDLAVDGARVYAVGSSSVAMFAADPAGDLEHLTTLADGPQRALAGAAAVEGRAGHVYVGSATDRAISVLEVDGETLGVVQTLTADDSPSLGAIAALKLSGDGRHLYAAVADGDRVVLLDRNAGDGTVTAVDAVAEAPPGRGLAAPSRLALSSDGRRLYVTSALNSSVALLEREPGSGGLTPARAAFDDTGGVIGIAGSADLALGPEQTHVYVSGPGDAAIGLFDAALTFLAVERNRAGAIDGLRQPAALAVAPDGGHVYVAGFGDGAVVILRRAADGSLAYEEAFRGAGERRLVQPIALSLSSDGDTLAVADFGAGAVQTLRRDPTTGALQPLAILDSDSVADLRGVVGVALSPDGDLAAAVSILSGSVILMTVGGDGAALALRATMPALAQPSFAAFDADGETLYVVSSGSDAVLTFERTAAGPFSQTQVVRASDPGVSGLASPASLAVTTGQVYVASGSGIFQLDGSNAVTVFDRRPSGALDFRAALVDEIDGVEGIRGATAVAVSPYGDTLAAAGFTGNSAAFFARDEGGALAFVEAHFDGQAGADGLGGASAVAFAPGGAELYVAGFADAAITAFRVPTPLPTPTDTPTRTPTSTPTATASPSPIPSASPTASSTATPEPTARHTATSPPAAACPGDCDGDDSTGIAELIRCVNIALGAADVGSCAACDANGDGEVAINELIQAVNAALDGCAAT